MKTRPTITLKEPMTLVGEDGEILATIVPLLDGFKLQVSQNSKVEISPSTGNLGLSETTVRIQGEPEYVRISKAPTMLLNAGMLGSLYRRPILAYRRADGSFFTAVEDLNNEGDVIGCTDRQYHDFLDAASARFAVIAEEWRTMGELHIP